MEPYSHMRHSSYTTRPWPRSALASLLLGMAMLLSVPKLGAQQMDGIDSLLTELGEQLYVEQQRNAIIGQLTEQYAKFRLDSLEAHADRVSALASEFNDPVLQGEALKARANSHYLNSEYRSAIPHLKKWLAAAQGLNNKEDLFEANNHLVGTYFYTGNVYAGLAHLQSAIEIAYELENQSYICSCIVNTASIHNRYGDYGNALELLLQGDRGPRCANRRAHDYYSAIIAAYTGLAAYDQALGQVKKLEAAPLESAGDALFVELYANYHRCIIDLKRNNLDLALRHGEKALRVFDKGLTEQKQYKGPIQLAMAKAYQQKGQLPQAITHTKKALENATAYRYQHRVFESAKLLKDLYATTGAPDSALYHAQLALEHNDLLKNSEEFKRGLLGLIPVERKISLGQKVNEIKINNAKNKVTILVLICLMGMLLIAFLIFKNRQLKSEKHKTDFNIRERIRLERQMDDAEAAIASDLHDNFGNRITGIITLLRIIEEALRGRPQSVQFGTFGKNLERFIRDIKNLLWAGNPNNNTVSALKARFDQNMFAHNEKAEKQLWYTSTYDREYKLPKFWNKQLLFSINALLDAYDQDCATGQLKLDLKIANSMVKVLFAVAEGSLGMDRDLADQLLQRLRPLDLEAKFTMAGKAITAILISGPIAR